MSRYVCVDASVAAKWVLPEVHSVAALDLRAACVRSQTTIAVPPHFPVEVVNIIRRRVVRGFLTHVEGRAALDRFVTFSVELVIPPLLYERAFDLAETFGLPAVYDAHYVVLAELLGRDLWTDDQRLPRAVGGKLSFVRWIGD
jgi:predicted nucleic acid-binding protein